MREVRRNKKILIFLGIVLCLMTVGYAAFYSRLDITGTSSITNSWDVEITNVSVGTTTGNGENVSTPTWNALTASMEANVYESGDSVSYTVTISNLGTLDAKLDEITKNIKTNNEAVKIEFSGYTKGERLYKAGESGSTKTITVTISFNDDYSGELDYNTSTETSVMFNYVQADGNNTDPDNPIPDTYLITYDCTTTGGKDCSEYNEYLNEGDSVDLTKTPEARQGYDFIGWNTDSSATTALQTLTVGTNNVTLYAIYEALDSTPSVINSVNTTKTNTSITVVVAASDQETNISKYEFSKDNGSTWVDNGTNNVYTFINLATDNDYGIKVRVTNGVGMTTTSDTISVRTGLSAPTFEENILGSTTTVTVNYPDGCDSPNTCSYIKDGGTAVTVTEDSVDVDFTDSGTLVATTSDGTSTVNSSYTVTYLDGVIEQGTETYSTAGSSTFTVPATGDYYLQVWGAQGGTSGYDVQGGLGGYSYGTVTLNKGDILYIYTGGQGSAGTSYETENGGYNGGGTSYGDSAGGGGASDIRINSDSLYARVIVAGGGGGSGEDECAIATNGYGGGEFGGGASDQDSCGIQGGGGTQTAGGAAGVYDDEYYGTPGSFGQGGNAPSGDYQGGGGGGGWYGGGSGASSDWSTGAGGGSGYVYTESTASNYPTGCLLDSSYYLKDAATMDGNTSFESPTGGTETGHSGAGYVKITYNIDTKNNDRLILESSNITTNSISVTATPKEGLNVTKYEFSKDGGSTWINNGTSSSYTFTGLTHNTTYNIKVRATTQEGKVVGNVVKKTKKIIVPVFSDANGDNSVNTTITYPSGCGSTYTCTYKKNSDSPVTVTSNTEVVNFTKEGTLIATISDGTNTVIETHTPEENITLSFSTAKTTSTITVTDTVNSPTAITKYEYQIDDGNWIEYSSNVYVFERLTSGTHSVNTRVTTNFGTVKTAAAKNVMMNIIIAPQYKVEYKAKDDGDVTITYPSGCGSTFTCTYIKNSEGPVTVISTTAVVNFSADGEVSASITDGTNTKANSFTVTMPLDVINNYGVNIPVVGSGDGLYNAEEGTDDTLYIYRGENPNNYIKLGSDLYRIMSIDSLGNLKVIKDTPLTSKIWDPGYSTSISGITSESSTAGTRYSSTSTDFCYASSEDKCVGCKSWGSKTSTLNSAGTRAVTQMPWQAGNTTLKNLPIYDSYMNVYLNGGTYPTSSGTTTLTSWYSTNVASTVQSKMVDHLWNVGPTNEDSSLTLAQNIEQEAAYKWRGKVGLMTVTDYVRASTNPACTNVYDYKRNSSCYNNSYTHNWLNKSINQWTMSPSSS